MVKMSHSFNLNRLNRQIFERVLDQLRNEGTQVTELDHYVSIEGSGISASAVLNGDTATVTIHDKPFLVPNSLIESRVREAVERARRT